MQKKDDKKAVFWKKKEADKSKKEKKPAKITKKNRPKLKLAFPTKRKGK